MEFLVIGGIVVGAYYIQKKDYVSSSKVVRHNKHSLDIALHTYPMDMSRADVRGFQRYNQPQRTPMDALAVTRDHWARDREQAEDYANRLPNRRRPQIIATPELRSLPLVNAVRPFKGMQNYRSLNFSQGMVQTGGLPQYGKPFRKGLINNP